jgi:hypothetical protein
MWKGHDMNNALCQSCLTGVETWVLCLSEARHLVYLTLNPCESPSTLSTADLLPRLASVHLPCISMLIHDQPSLNIQHQCLYYPLLVIHGQPAFHVHVQAPRQAHCHPIAQSHAMPMPMASPHRCLAQPCKQRQNKTLSLRRQLALLHSCRAEAKLNVDLEAATGIPSGSMAIKGPAPRALIPSPTVKRSIMAPSLRRTIKKL